LEIQQDRNNTAIVENYTNTTDFDDFRWKIAFRLLQMSKMGEQILEYCQNDRQQVIQFLKE
jgi:hypothetical protein